MGDPQERLRGDFEYRFSDGLFYKVTEPFLLFQLSSLFGELLSL